MPRTGNLLGLFLGAVVVMLGIAVGKRVTQKAGI